MLRVINNAIVINNYASKIQKFCVLHVAFFIKTYWNCSCFFYNFISRTHCIVSNIFQIFSVCTSACSKIPNKILFIYMMLLRSTFFHYSTLDLNYIFLRQIIFTFTWFIFPVIILKICIFKPSVLFRAHTLLDK